MSMNPCADSDHPAVAAERAVWEALCRDDAQADLDLLHPAFLGVYPGGTADRTAHAAQLAHGPSIERFEWTGLRVMPLADCVVMVSYRAHFSRVGQAGPMTQMWVSSAWVRDPAQGDRWLNAFSQDTPCADAQP